MRRLDGRCAIVTGAASGIGRASAELFAAEGARVLAVDRPATELAFADAAVRACAADLAAADAPRKIVAAALDELGGVDILFNNAGIGLGAPAVETTDEAWDQVQAVNLRAVFRLCREAIPHLVASKAGRVICTASVMANGTDYGLAAYCASKAGVVGLTRTLALELGRSGVTANAILPGAILTGMTRRNFSDPKIADVWARKSVLKRLGQPIDIARLALFLASDEAAFVTGQAIACDGGLTLRI
ncbi:MAG TPA: SDR family NAD(P)-dependent oxidoreductase [Caulobacteraceae bacterium]|nr:SDR family NAD(P)-dependent oxidoreductase [Caulobacteraceae bacterium]